MGWQLVSLFQPDPLCPSRRLPLRLVDFWLGGLLEFAHRDHPLRQHEALTAEQLRRDHPPRLPTTTACTG